MGEPARHSHPLDIRRVGVTDEFWRTQQELVRTAVIPYQWDALNDAVPGAAPSYCMHNFRAAARQNAAKAREGRAFVPPTYTFRGFEALPEDPSRPDPDTFYGFVFQDTDFSKWVEAVGYSLARHPDSELEATADAAIEIVCAAQLDNGYLDTYYILNGMDRHFTYLKDHHELYCLGHLIEGAVAYYQGTGKDRLLGAACRFADYVDSVFGREPGKLRGYPGHEIAEMALVRLYETTGEQRYLHLARYFVTERGQSPLYFEQEDHARAEHDGTPFVPNTNLPKPYAYYQAHEPVTEQDEAVGHAVRACYFYSGVADVARLTGDADLLAACRRLWRSIVDRKLYVTGGVGGTHIGEAFSFDYDLPNDTAYSETCAAIALAFFARRMLEIEPVGEYADVMELALYNTTLAGMALDGKSFFYVNPLEVDPKACHQDERKFHVKPVRQKWFGCACCPPNIARIIESIQQYAYTVDDDSSTLYTHLYIGGTATVDLGADAGRSLTLEMTAGMPWRGDGRAVVRIADGAAGVVSSSAGAGVGGHADDRDGCDKPSGIRLGACGDHADCTGGSRGGEGNGAGDGNGPADGDHDRLGVAATLAFRLPAWAGGEAAADAVAVQYADDSSTPRIAREVRDGYVYLTGIWHDGDAVAFDFPMPVRMLAADPRVREDAGKVAFMRGPIAFCAEGVDNGPDLHLLHVDAETVAAHPESVRVDDITFHAGARGVDESGLGEVDAVDRPMVTLTVPGWRETADDPGTAGDPAAAAPPSPASSPTAAGLYRPWRPVRRMATPVTLIPYFAWANRGENEMAVWLRV